MSEEQDPMAEETGAPEIGDDQGTAPDPLPDLTDEIIEETAADSGVDAEQTAGDAGAEAASEATTDSALPPAEMTDIDMGPERRTSPWVWVGVAAAVVAIGIIGFVLWWASSRPIAVPEVSGKPSAQATQELNDAGLRLGKVSEEPTAAAPAGVVVSQVPSAGVELTPGEPVDLVVAAPPDRATVPDVTGKPVEDARETLAAQRLAVQEVETYSTTATAGTVIGQVPAADSLVVPGASVGLAVSKGQQPSQIPVPNVGGLTADDAKTQIVALGLVPAGYRSFDASVAAGRVATQSPLPGTKATEGDVVQYLISDGPGTALVVVPNTIGQTRKTAEDSLKAKGLKPKVLAVPNRSVPAGQVFSQMPEGNARAGKGATVGIVVSLGPPEEKPVPQVAGKSKADAEAELKKAGFTPVLLEVAVEGETPGQVFAQFPSAGTSWSYRFPVIALVAIAK